MGDNRSSAGQASVVEIKPFEDHDLFYFGRAESVLSHQRKGKGPDRG
jgi:hypothetical protein